MVAKSYKSSARQGHRASKIQPYDEKALRRAKQRFKEIFPRGFKDNTYLAWEREYKWTAHRTWSRTLGRLEWRNLLQKEEYEEVARRIAIFYARANLNMLALYEWMALREALVHPVGARLLATGLYELIHGRGPFAPRFEQFIQVLDEVPQPQTKLAKWPVATLFPFVAHPGRHLIVKPKLIKRVADRFGLDLKYTSRPNPETYGLILDFAGWLQKELAAWHPRDLIDIQGFLWVTASEEYDHWPWE